MSKSVFAASAVLFAWAAFGQGTAPTPKFEMADIHASAPKRFAGVVTLVRGGRYELRMATMVDLVRIAYDVPADRVLEGPSWLEYDRFDVMAKGPARANAETQRAMLQSLLAERFKLVVRKETRQMPAYALTAGKRPALKKATGEGPPGCKFDFSGPGQREPGSPPLLTYNCRNTSMARFSEDLSNAIGAPQYFFGAPVLDKTGLEGAWDFDFKYSLRGAIALSGEGSISLLDAVEKQLGLKLEPIKAPLPVITVVSANQKPTDNAAGVAAAFPGGEAPTEFEVADVKLSAPDSDFRPFQIQPGGRVHVSGMTVVDLIQQAWELRADMLLNAPKWAAETRFDIVAKAPAGSESTEITSGMRMNPGEPAAGPQVDFDTVLLMLRGLLKDRFKLEMHTEERPVNAYTLVAVKPKMKKADPASRTRFNAGPSPNTRTLPPGTRLVTVQNMTMAQFAEQLTRIAPAYFQSPVLNATNLEGAYDFTLVFAPAGAVRGGSGGRGGKRGGPGVDAGGGEPSDPTGVMSLPEAIERELGLKLEQQKRPVQVWVIDRVERPSAN
jgi:uncharacterized protein (TIGR03435 family)